MLGIVYLIDLRKILTWRLAEEPISWNVHLDDVRRRLQIAQRVPFGPFLLDCLVARFIRIESHVLAVFPVVMPQAERIVIVLFKAYHLSVAGLVQRAKFLQYPNVLVSLGSLLAVHSVCFLVFLALSNTPEFTSGRQPGLRLPLADQLFRVGDQPSGRAGFLEQISPRRPSSSDRGAPGFKAKRRIVEIGQLFGDECNDDAGHGEDTDGDHDKVGSPGQQLVVPEHCP